MFNVKQIFFIRSRWNLIPLFFSAASVRDADGDVDTCPMWTFPTVRPTSMNKLQKGYTHPDSEARHPTLQLHTHLTRFFSSKSFFPHLQSGDSVKRQPKSQSLSALVTPIFKEVKPWDSPVKPQWGSKAASEWTSGVSGSCQMKIDFSRKA